MENCCSLPSKDNQNDVILLQLKRELEDLKNTTAARLLIQDGKIAETCVFLKNNLSNSIRELLDTLQSSGDLDDIITTTVLSSIDLLQNQVEFKELPRESYAVNIQYPYGHVKRYGAAGDGVKDDTEALNICIENCIRFGVPLTADQGTYKISGDVNMRYIKRVNFAGDIVTDNSSYVTIGNASSDGSGCYLNFNNVKYLNVIGLKNSIVSFLYCDKLTIAADGDDPSASSTAYTQFNGAYCKEIVFESSGTNIGWINENVFRIKRIEAVTMGGNYAHNNNHFEHCNLERGVINLNNARNNYFSARSEGGITINATGEETQANFFEKEYYYRHYFGEDVSEDEKGSLSFYPVNKLQTERELYRLDAYNKSFPIGSVFFKENGTFSGMDYHEVYRSNLVKIDNTFALKMKCSTAAMRVQLNFYDANKNRITAAVDNFADGKMQHLTSGDWSYIIGVNVNNDSVVFYPGTAKYVEYRVIFGDSAESKSIEYLKVKLLKYINTDINITNTVVNDVYTSVPTSGYWERGHKLYAKNPTPGTYIGIICVESGTPGTWNNFAQIQG